MIERIYPCYSIYPSQHVWPGDFFRVFREAPTAIPRQTKPVVLICPKCGKKKSMSDMHERKYGECRRCVRKKNSDMANKPVRTCKVCGVNKLLSAFGSNGHYKADTCKECAK